MTLPATALALFAALPPVLLEDPPASKSGGPNMMFLLLALVAIFWFLVINPERKQRRRRQEMISGIGKGDKVMTNGGMYGTVTKVQDETVTLQIADGVRVRFSLQSVQGLADEKQGGTEEKKKSDSEEPART
jgi:preprotein translocase subunit YajC